MNLKIKKNNFYQNNFFITPAFGTNYFVNFLKSHQVKFGLFLTFNFMCSDLKKYSVFYENYISNIINQVFKKYYNIFFLTTNFVYSGFVKLDDKDSKLIAELEKRIELFTNYINKFLKKANAYYEVRVFSVKYGYDFFDYNSLIQIGEFGIYNFDYGDKKFYKKFLYKDFVFELKQAELKKKLRKFLSNFNFRFELNLNQNYWCGNFVDIKNFIFEINFFLKEFVPLNLQSIFLRFCNINFLKKYKKNKNFNYPILLTHPIDYLIENPKKIDELFWKIKQLDISPNLIVFCFYQNKHINYKLKNEIYQKFAQQNFKIIDISL